MTAATPAAAEGARMAPTPTITADAAGISDTTASRTRGAVEQLIAPLSAWTTQDVDVTRLHEHPDNPRGDVGDVTELADSIRASGIFEPLIVVPASVWQETDDRLPTVEAGDFIIIAGHRRAAAAVKADRRTVPCIIRDDLTGALAEVAMLVENVQREDLSTIQEARGYANLEAAGRSQREIARLVGKTQPHVSKRLSLLKLPDELQAKVDSDEITVTDGVELAKIADDPKVLKAVLKRPSWQSIGDATAAVLEQRKRDDAAEERRKQLRAAGIQHVVKYPENGYSRWAPAKDVPLDWLEEDGVDVAEHEHFACHGVAVGHSRYGSELRVVPICTNAKAHPESKTAKAAVGRDKQAAAVERDAAATLRRKQARLDLLAGLCGKTVDPTAEAIAYLHLADDVFEYFYDDDARDLCAVLGVTIPDEPPAGPDNRAEDALRTFIDAADDKTVRRFVVAAQLLLLDNQRSRGPIGGRYLAMLGGRGYKLDKDERATVAKLEAPVAS